jgi:hypothetical protein
VTGLYTRRHGHDSQRRDCSKLKAAFDQLAAHVRNVKRAVPDVCHIPLEQSPCHPPIHAIVICDFPDCATTIWLSVGALRAVAPIGIVVHAVGRVGDHQVRLRTGQQGLDFGALGRVAAEQPMAPKLPEISGACDRINGHRRHIVRR